MCWTPFWAVSGRDPPKRGPPPHQFRPLPFSRRWTPFCALSGRDPPKRAPPPHPSRRRTRTTVQAKASRKEKHMTQAGVEPLTFRLRVICSTNWARPAWCERCARQTLFRTVFRERDLPKESNPDKQTSTEDRNRESWRWYSLYVWQRHWEEPNGSTFDVRLRRPFLEDLGPPS